jgi:hypothetical protein
MQIPDVDYIIINDPDNNTTPETAAFAYANAALRQLSFSGLNDYVFTTTGDATVVRGGTDDLYVGYQLWAKLRTGISTYEPLGYQAKCRVGGVDYPDLSPIVPDATTGIGVPMMGPLGCLLSRPASATQPEGGECGTCGGYGGTGEPPTVYALILAHNDDRSARGLGTLTENAALTAAITDHLAWLDERGLPVQHAGAGGSTPLDRAIAAGYVGVLNTYVTENLTQGEQTVEHAMQEWIASPMHFANLTDPVVTEIGVAISELPTPGYYRFGALFGHRTDEPE